MQSFQNKTAQEHNLVKSQSAQWSIGSQFFYDRRSSYNHIPPPISTINLDRLTCQSVRWLSDYIVE